MGLTPLYHLGIRTCLHVSYTQSSAICVISRITNKVSLGVLSETRGLSQAEGHTPHLKGEPVYDPSNRCRSTGSTVARVYLL